MKSVRSTKSVRSIRSTRSLRTSGVYSNVISANTELLGFENLLPITCAKFDCPYNIRVERAQRNGW